MKLKISLIISLLLALTAHSQIIGIPLENKKEILKTILDYPLVLEELDIEKRKNKTFESILLDERKKISIYEEITRNKQLEINKYEEQLTEYKAQLKKKGRGFYAYTSIDVNYFSSPEVGVLYKIVNSFGLMSDVSYNAITRQPEFRLGFLIKL